MISIRRYLDGTAEAPTDARVPPRPRNGNSPIRGWIEAYRGAVEAFSQAGADACPALAQELTSALSALYAPLGGSTPAPAEVDEHVRLEVRGWGRKAAVHYREKAAEVKQVLLAMARTAESVSERDQRCAVQIESLTTKLRKIASLDDITQIRQSIEQSAQEIKGSIDRVAAEGKAALDGMQAKISEFQTRLEEAEQAASIDALTRLRTRVWLEAQLEERVAAQRTFCVALLDLDGFKFVNDRYGHLAGDELLRQFAGELRASCRSTDLVARWGGDEFLMLLEGPFEQAEGQIERVRAWVCGNYELEKTRLRVEASIGLAAFTPPETLEQLLERADQAMYAHKTARR